MMFSLGMYVIETVEDGVRCEEHEIFTFLIDETECTNCGMVVGPVDDEFFPCVVIASMENDDAWPICLDCATPLLFPTEWIIELEI